MSESSFTTNLPAAWLQTLFVSPDLYPARIDFEKRTVGFVRMSRETYRNSVFLDHRTLSLGIEIYEIRLDDLLLASWTAASAPRKVHYILHPTFSCSTLLARYFELIPSSLVLKEPMLLTQLGLRRHEILQDWDNILRLCMQMLTRTYSSGDFVVIKPHEPCNALAGILLSAERSTATFLMGPAKEFVLAHLKTQSRRNWVRTRIPAAAQAAQCEPLVSFKAEDLTDAQACAYLWLVNRLICEQCCQRYGDRILRLDPNQLVESPAVALEKVMRSCELSLSGSQLRLLLDHPSIKAYSKDPSRPYGPSVRRNELAELEYRFGDEADSAMHWIESRGMAKFL
jgi:hypothetical protein